MEFERALFRVYDRSLESLRSNQPCFRGGRLRPNNVCQIIEILVLTLILLSVLLLGTVHMNFVGEYAPQCLHSELDYQRELQNLDWLQNENVPNQTLPKYPLLGKNKILQIGIGKKGTKEKLKYLENIYGENSTDLNGAGDGEFKKTYRFTENPPLLYLNDGFVKNHEIEVVNITISRDCLSQGSGLLNAAVSIVGYDTIIINQLFSVGAGGVLENSHTKEEWGWNHGFLPSKHGRSFGEALSFKLAIFSETCFAFFFVATVTSLIVRMLISSGVVVMFPLFWLLQLLGFRDLDMHILTLSYPWLGLPVEVLRRMGKPTSPLIWAHVLRVVILYSMYEACQLAWSVWFYDKPLPDGLQLEVFAIVMIWEYFAMIYLRSANGIYFLPKFTWLYFAAFHFYLYGHPYAFFGVALFIFYLLIAHALLATVIHFEVQAAERLEITFENPRAYFIELPWQAWQASLPPSWTLFMPLNARRRNIYDDAPAPPTNTNQQDVTGGDSDEVNDIETGTTNGGGGDDDEGGIEFQELRSTRHPESESVNRVVPEDGDEDDEDDEPELRSSRRSRRSDRRRGGGSSRASPALEERPLMH